MSFTPTLLRPFAQMGWGGRVQFRAAEQFLGAPLGGIVYRSLGVKANRAIVGVTRDSAGTPLASCRVELFQTGGDIPTNVLTSDASGNFSFDNPGSGPFYIVAYKAAGPDVAGTTVNTLIAV